MRRFATLALAAAICCGRSFAGDGSPRIDRVCTVAPDIIAVRIDAGIVEYGRQVPYAPKRGDKVDRKSHQRWVHRGGAFIGSLVGRDEKILYTPDRLVGRPLDIAAADRLGSWSVTGPKGAVKIESVHRKTKPSDLARVGSWQYGSPTVSWIYLKAAGPLAKGSNYTIAFGGLEAALKYDPSRTRSEAVHVSHIGFRPDDPAKVAFLSCWMGGGGPLDYAAGLGFTVVDGATGAVHLSGKTKLSKAAADATEDPYKRNYNGTDVFVMDFTKLSRPGKYRVVVEGIGCSYAFPIGDETWRDAFYVSARGFYHQRSGISLGPPYTKFKRPRAFHPDDGMKVFASTAALMDTGNGLNRKDSNFGELVKGKTDEIVAGAWGGYMDAGDWDRRIQHLESSRLLLELAGIAPDYFARLSLNIPESKDGLPDAVSEALFNIDCYRRMQTPAGGIRGGIESSQHPRNGEGSWQESLDVMAYAPGVWSSYEYAGVAARAAVIIGKKKPRLAAEYRASALKAMEWAEKELPGRAGRKDPHAVKDSRNLAAAELWRLTGEKRWGDLFLATTVFKDGAAPLYKWQHHNQRHAAWVYLRSRRGGADATVKANCRAAIFREADGLVAQSLKTGFRWTKDPWRPVAWGCPVAPDGVTLCRAHAITGDRKYLRTAVLACQFGGGANPSNMCYTTGLGHQWPKHPLHIDSRITNQPPPPGLTVFGPLDTKKSQDEWGQKLCETTLHPKGPAWPTLEAYWDVFWYPPMCEYTVQSPMAQNAYTWGYLAARK